MGWGISDFTTTWKFNGLSRGIGSTDSFYGLSVRARSIQLDWVAEINRSILFHYHGNSVFRPRGLRRCWRVSFWMKCIGLSLCGGNFRENERLFVLPYLIWYIIHVTFIEIQRREIWIKTSIKSCWIIFVLIFQNIQNLITNDWRFKSSISCHLISRKSPSNENDLLISRSPQKIYCLK